MTNNHVLHENDINIGKTINFSINDEKEEYTIEIDEDRKVYTNKEYDITIIEIKKEDKINCEYFEYEQNDFIEENIKESIYILHYPGDENVSVSYGIINKIFNEYEFIHYCSTDNGSSGSPIINLKNKKIIGIHKGTKNKYNLGTFLNFPINIFIKQNYIDNNLIEFNKKFKMNINYNITILDLSGRKDKCWEYLLNLDLNELKELDLSYNNISDISF
jgi:V8-like Glu-specific endopeptidase